MGSLRIHVTTPLPLSGNTRIKEAALGGVRVGGFEAQVQTGLGPRVRPWISVVMAMTLFVLCTVGGMFAQIANQGAKDVEATPCMPWDNQNCSRGDRLIKRPTTVANGRSWHERASQPLEAHIAAFAGPARSTTIATASMGVK